MRTVIDWLNENEQRAYPLCTDPGEMTHSINGEFWTIPDNLLLDLKLITSKKLTNLDVYLTELNYTANNTIELVFEAGVDEISKFVVTGLDNITYPLYLRNPDGNLVVFGEGLSLFYSKCTAPTQLSLSLRVEPTVCIEYGAAWLGVTSLGALPEKKTIVLSPANDWLFPYEPLRPLENVSAPTRLTGHIKLLEGYNFAASTLNGVVDLEIAFGEGLKMNCTTNFLQPEYLDCNQLVSYINGASPDPDDNSFKLTSSSDIVITAGNVLDPFVDNFSEQSNQNTLFFGLAQKATDLCKPIHLF
jgi:hypothetical protein